MSDKTFITTENAKPVKITFKGEGPSRTLYVHGTTSEDVEYAVKTAFGNGNNVPTAQEKTTRKRRTKAEMQAAEAVEA